MKNILILKDQPLQKREYDFLDIQSISKKNLINIFIFKSFFSNSKTKKIINYKIKEISSFFKTIKCLKKINFVIDLMSNKASFKTAILRQILKIKKKKIIQFHIDSLIIEEKKKENSFSLNMSTIIKLINFIFSFMKKKANEYYVDYAFVGVRNDLKNVNKKYLKKKIFCHSTHYDFFLKNKSKKIYKKNFSLYIDSTLTYHPDYKKLNLMPPIQKADLYFDELENFFQFYEKNKNLKIIIAGNPKIEKKFYNKYFKKRLYFINLTPELVSEAKEILVESSTALNFAIIKKKPIYFLYNDELKNQKNSWDLKRINFVSQYLGRPKINISNQLNKSFFKKKFTLENRSKYNRYFSSYIKNSNTINSSIGAKLETLLNA